MAKNDMMAKIGSWSFIIGIIIALVVGLYTAMTIEDGNNFLLTTNGGYVAWVLALIGAIVGILAILGRGTITKQEVPGFLIAGIALVVMAGAFGWAGGLKPVLGSLLSGVSMCLAIFVAPAVGLLAIKAIWDMGKEA